MGFIPQKYLCVDELVIMDRSRQFNPRREYILLYSLSKGKRYYVRYIKTASTLLLEKGDMGKAFDVENGEGYQDYRTCIKEIVYNLSDYIALTDYILVSCGIKDYRRDINIIQKDWFDDNI